MVREVTLVDDSRLNVEMLYGPLIRIGPEVPSFSCCFPLDCYLTWSMCREYNSQAPGTLLAYYHLADARGFVLDFSATPHPPRSNREAIQSFTPSAQCNPNPNSLQLSPIIQCSLNIPELFLSDVLPNLHQKRHLFRVQPFKSFIIGALQVCRYSHTFQDFFKFPPHLQCFWPKNSRKICYPPVSLQDINHQ
jgi:hypothetical protein